MRGRGGRSGYVSQLPPRPEGFEQAKQQLQEAYDTPTSHVGWGFGIDPSSPARAHGDTSIREGHWFFAVYTDDPSIRPPALVAGIPVVRRALPRARAVSLGEGALPKAPPKKQDKVT